MSDAPRPRGSFVVYGLAFALLVLAGGAVAIAAWSFLESFTTLWLSIVASVSAIVASIVAVMLPRRR